MTVFLRATKLSQTFTGTEIHVYIVDFHLYTPEKLTSPDRQAQRLGVSASPAQQVLEGGWSLTIGQVKV